MECSSSVLSQLPGTVRLRGRYEALVSNAVDVAQRRQPRKTRGSEAPTKERMEENEDIVTGCFVINDQESQVRDRENKLESK